MRLPASHYDKMRIVRFGRPDRPQGMEVVFTLLAERYERGSVLMTSNLVVLQKEFLQRAGMGSLQLLRRPALADFSGAAAWS
jgi:hypothetical protein